ncbi:hypothetical protein MMC10_002172 [Thelotrema lepadinum]|nr:hypothetical protein [Thelotrema lepadinum]
MFPLSKHDQAMKEKLEKAQRKLRDGLTSKRAQETSEQAPLDREKEKAEETVKTDYDSVQGQKPQTLRELVIDLRNMSHDLVVKQAEQLQLDAVLKEREKAVAAKEALLSRLERALEITSDSLVQQAEALEDAKKQFASEKAKC